MTCLSSYHRQWFLLNVLLDITGVSSLSDFHEEEERLCVIPEGKRVTPENKVFSKQSKSLGKQMENQIKRSLTMEGAKRPGSRP